MGSRGIIQSGAGGERPAKEVGGLLYPDTRWMCRGRTKQIQASGKTARPQCVDLRIEGRVYTAFVYLGPLQKSESF